MLFLTFESDEAEMYLALDLISSSSLGILADSYG